MTMMRPELSDKCRGCTHPFSDHAQSYGGTRTGCLMRQGGCYPDGDPSYCHCEGFTIMYREQVLPEATIHHATDAVPQWGPYRGNI
jgi:hypothetical protein